MEKNLQFLAATKVRWGYLSVGDQQSTTFFFVEITKRESL